MAVDALLARGYESLSRGAFDAWLEGLHDDAELHELAEIPDTAVYRGHEEIRAWAEAAMALTVDWEWIPEEVIWAADGVIVVRVRFIGRGAESGAPLAQVIFHVLEFRDRKAAVIRGFLGEREALRAAGATG